MMKCENEMVQTRSGHSLLAGAIAGSVLFAAGTLLAQSAPGASRQAELSAASGSVVDRMLRQNYSFVVKAGSVSLSSEDPSTALSQSIGTRQWDKAAKLLATLSADDASRVFQRICISLSSAAESVAPDQMDVLDLSGILPPGSMMNEPEIQALAQLLAKATARADLTDAFMDRLNKGVGQLGGSQPRGRNSAGMLLLMANRSEQASQFVSSFDEAMKSSDAQSISLTFAVERAGAERAIAAKDQAAAKTGRERMLMLSRHLLELSNLPERMEQATILNFFSLSAEVDECNTFKSWFTGIIHKNPRQAMGILAACMMSDAGANRSVDNRSSLLRAQATLTPLLISTAQERNDAAPQIHAILNGLSEFWLREAEGYINARKNAPQPMTNTQSPGGRARPAPANNFGSTANTVPPAVLARTIPDANLIDRMSPGVQLRYQRTIFQIQIAAGEPDQALRSLEKIGSLSASAVRELSGIFLDAWAAARDPEDVRDPNTDRKNGGITPMIPVTRIMQEANIRELTQIAATIENLQKSPVPAGPLVNAFGVIHGKTNYFQVADIQAVFGPSDRIPDETMLVLVSLMRQNLSSTWRMNGNRFDQGLINNQTDKKIVDSVIKAYDLAISLVESGNRMTQWRFSLIRAMLLFEKSELLFTRGETLPVYSQQRDAALAAMADAASLYAKTVTSEAQPGETIAVYQLWFDATVNASDLQQPNRKPESDDQRIALIRKAILDLPGDAAERHMARQAAYLANRVSGLKPEVRPSYARSALLLVGDHPAAKPIQAMVRLYDGLLKEIEFTAQVDGSAAIGDNQPFGLKLSIRTTRQLFRESPSFVFFGEPETISAARPQVQPYAANRESQAYRKELESQVRRSLMKGYEVVNLIWLDGAVNPVSFGRTDWVEVPVAYVVLRATDPSVDVVPSIQIGMDFFDRNGAIKLPISSSLVPVNARQHEVHPMASVHISQTLNDSLASSGKLTVDIKAAGTGLVPDINELLDMQSVQGYKIARIIDQGLQVTSYGQNADGDSPEAQAPRISAERVWMVELTADGSVPNLNQFSFPKPRANISTGKTEIEYRKYSGSNIIEVGPSVELNAAPPKMTSNDSKTVLYWSAGGLLAAGLVAGLLYKRRKPNVVNEQPKALLPEQLTPFGAITILRRIQTTQRDRLSDAQLTQITQAIDGIEKHYFAVDDQPGHSLELLEIVRPWVGR